MPDKKVTLRLEESVHDRLALVAKHEDRSFTAQINRALREWLDQHEAATRSTR